MKYVIKYVTLTVLYTLSLLVYGGHELEPIEEPLADIVKELGYLDCAHELNASFCLAMNLSAH